MTFYVVLLLFCAPVRAGITVTVSGVSGEEKANIEARLSIRRPLDAERLDQALVTRLHRDAQREIATALQPYGYYQPEIVATLSGAAPDWQASYRVTLGSPTRIGVVDVKVTGPGADLPEVQQALSSLPVKAGQRLLHAQYNSAKTLLLRSAYDHGFLDARWTQNELRVYPERQLADIVLRLETGPRYYFGEMTVEQEGLDPALIDRYRRIRAGQPVQSSVMLQQQFVYSDLGYFDTVEVELQRQNVSADHRVPVRVRTEPRNRRHYDFGVGYGTDTGARISLGTEWRRLNAQGHKLKTNLRLSEIKNTLAAEYLIPIGSQPDESLSFSAASETENLEDGDTVKYSTSVALNRSPGDWRRRLYVEFLHEETDFGTETTNADLLMPGLSLTRTEVDNPARTLRGWYLFGDVHGADEALLSTATFVQTRVVARAVYPPAQRFRILGRAEWGATYTDAFSELPASQRFFAGGDQSVRGYAYQALAPRNDAGEVIGGKYLTAFSLEGEYSVHGNWAGALFIDAGGADDDPRPKLYRGVGVGVRYALPIGDLRLDVAHPLDGDEPPLRLHFGVRIGL